MIVQVRDLNSALVAACVDEGLDAQVADILTLSGVLVSPANSFGFMDGGLDAYISERHPKVANIVQSAIVNNFNGILPVGLAFAVATGDAEQPWLIVAPTMFTPATNLNGTLNAFLATRAATQAYRDLWQARTEVREGLPLLLPGMGTGAGGLDLKIGARQMSEGTKQGFYRYSSWRQAKKYEEYLLGG